MVKFKSKFAYQMALNDIKVFLADALGKNEISFPVVMDILLIFNVATSVKEVKFFVLVFSKFFPVLTPLNKQFETKVKNDFYVKVQKNISKILKKNLIKAAEIVKKASYTQLMVEDLIAVNK